MIDEKTKQILNEEGVRLSRIFPRFFGKIVFNFHDGVYANANVEQSVKNVNLNKRSENAANRS